LGWIGVFCKDTHAPLPEQVATAPLAAFPGGLGLGSELGRERGCSFTLGCGGGRRRCQALLAGLNELIAARRLTQARTAKLFGIPQPHVSEFEHYKLNGFSSERLLRFVTLLDRDVENIIRPKAAGQCRSPELSGRGL
jgi:predicted XRE-type DNA-binding protein